ncbi:unnamed protein product [Dibothriocephalus latus]|uniref:Protein kinase domain-containing protein n=1 Tax=Dibothriocephalus latus TaxID=60516 RepID=A0A3P6RMM8_DIBLA|nr:unnamed protein product [Dibothriocephalus latus]
MTGFMEVAIMLDLNNTHIVRLCGWGVEDQILYIITELVPGQTLSSFVQMAKYIDLSTMGLEKILMGIAQGLRYLEARKLVHGNLAAQHIFLDKDKTPKVSLAVLLYHYTSTYFSSLFVILVFVNGNHRVVDI